MLALPRVKPGDPAGDAVLSALKGAMSRIEAVEAEARRGDSEGIHRLRTTTRRLRSELRAFRDFVDLSWLEPIITDLKWLAGLLGEVRDPDVLSARLTAAAGAHGDSDLPALAPLFEELQARHARGFRALRDALAGDRYRKLLAALQRAIENPVLNDEAQEPCCTALPPLAAAAWRRLKKGARGLRPSDPEEEFHEVRKRAKRARYTAELIAPVLGRVAEKRARRFIRRTTEVQTVLGEHQDAIVAGLEVERVLAEHSEDAAVARAAARLLETQRDAAQKARSEFFEVWDKLDRKKSRRWWKIVSKVKC
jgi:CHAD domain-containing protein